MCSRITVTKNEMKYIKKVIRYLDNIIILLKASTRNISTQKGGFPYTINVSLFTINEKCSYTIS